jgi:hypothetical protein
MLFKQSLIIAPHLTANTAHNLFASIWIQLPPPRLSPDNILAITSSH